MNISHYELQLICRTFITICVCFFVWISNSLNDWLVTVHLQNNVIFIINVMCKSWYGLRDYVTAKVYEFYRYDNNLHNILIYKTNIIYPNLVLIVKFV